MILCIVLVVWICLAQIWGSTMLLLAGLGAYLVLLGWSCIKGSVLPILLFFLPWSPVMRLSPDNVSFYTIGILLACLIGVFENGFAIKKTFLLLGFVMLATTLLTRLIDANGLSMSYLQFIAMIFLIPSLVKQQKKQSDDFEITTLFFAVGVILAAFIAQQVALYPNIRKYIVVHSYVSVTRWCGFYGDPNFYAAQVVAAMTATMLLILRGNRRQVVVMAVLTVLLLYCGMLSGSKSFLLIFIGVFVMWLIKLFAIRGRVGAKLLIYCLLGAAAVYIAFSEAFQDLLNIILLRFLLGGNSASGFTTGRSEIWKNYLEEIFTNPKILLLGNGFCNILIKGRASHNTLIQAVFQFGIIGVPFLIMWVWNFYTMMIPKDRKNRKWSLESLILVCGVFVPWVALDMLFFDEFFLFQWFGWLGVREFMTDERRIQKRTAGKHFNRTKKVRRQ